LDASVEEVDLFPVAQAERHADVADGTESDEAQKALKYPDDYRSDAKVRCKE
jgi:hypothetical protein